MPTTSWLTESCAERGHGNRSAWLHRAVLAALNRIRTGRILVGNSANLGLALVGLSPRLRFGPDITLGILDPLPTQPGVRARVPRPLLLLRSQAVLPILDGSFTTYALRAREAPQRGSRPFHQRTPDRRQADPIRTADAAREAPHDPSPGPQRHAQVRTCQVMGPLRYYARKLRQIAIPHCSHLPALLAANDSRSSLSSICQPGSVIGAPLPEDDSNRATRNKSSVAAIAPPPAFQVGAGDSRERSSDTSTSNWSAISIPPATPHPTSATNSIARPCALSAAACCLMCPATGWGPFVLVLSSRGHWRSGLRRRRLGPARLRQDEPRRPRLDRRALRRRELGGADPPVHRRAILEAACRAEWAPAARAGPAVAGLHPCLGLRGQMCLGTARSSPKRSAIALARAAEVRRHLGFRRPDPHQLAAHQPSPEGQSCTEAMVWLHLNRYWWAVGNAPFPSPERIAEHIGCHPRPVLRCFSRSEAKGAVQWLNLRASPTGSRGCPISLVPLAQSLHQIADRSDREPPEFTKDLKARTRPGRPLGLQGTGSFSSVGSRLPDDGRRALRDQPELRPPLTAVATPDRLPDRRLPCAHCHTISEPVNLRPRNPGAAGSSEMRPARRRAPENTLSTAVPYAPRVAFYRPICTLGAGGSVIGEAVR